MELDGEYGQFFVPHPLQGIVVQVNVRKLYVFLIQGVDIDAEAVVLDAYRDLTRLQIFYRLVSAVTASCTS